MELKPSPADPMTLLLAAKIQARGEYKTLQKTGQNPHLRTKYATLGDMLTACGGALAKHGLDLIHTLETRDGGLCLVARLMHVGGGEMQSLIPLAPAKQDAQALGSWITYARRYTTAPLLGLEADFEDDGEATVDRSVKPVKTEPEPAPEPEPPAEPESQLVTAEQVAHIETLVTEAHAKREKVLQFFDVAALSQLTVPQYESAVRMLTQQRAVIVKKAAAVRR